MRKHLPQKRLNRRAFREMERIATVIGNKPPLTMDCKGDLRCGNAENGRALSTYHLSIDDYGKYYFVNSHDCQ
jgi:hypothetical protein